ncbi:amino acid adenylation domain-containing protein [Rhizobium sp. NPDC090279]|uniref:amino acid adenylation domain-containing protein n=1 Tax=Rhizobium sp. NPDC090279 TaxID=3364499 RepID=UPI00383B540F
MDPDALAYVIYTSGSTGKPKGVMVPHSNVMAMMADVARIYDLGPTDVWSVFHSFSFDFSVFELWGALLFGGVAIVVPHLTARSPSDFIDLLIEQRITILSQTPSAFLSLVEYAKDKDERLRALGLRFVVFGGEALDISAIEPWVRYFGTKSPVLANMYGITETTVHASYREITLNDFKRSGQSPIGHPIPNLKIQILDKHMNLVPLGIPGEIYVSGSGVARGYLNRGGTTADRFIPNPFSSKPGDRLYRSGDLAKWTNEGELVFIGRADHQVKIRGFRIELGEIEAAIYHCPGVDKVFVMVTDTADDKQLVAYVSCSRESPIEEATIKNRIRDILPSYMVPHHVVVIEKFPINRNGKIDKTLLPRPGELPRSRDRRRSPPCNPVEDQLATVWSRVLKIDDVGIDDSFFDLGGDSIRAVRLVGALQQSGLGISVQDLFRNQTIRNLARIVGIPSAGENQLSKSQPFEQITDEERAGIPPGVIDAYPASLVQTGMLFEMLSDNNLNLYHNATRYLIRDNGKFSLEAFQAAVDSVIKRHDVLRTFFDLSSFARPLQLVSADAKLIVNYLDIRDLGAEQQKATLDESIRNNRATRFALNSPPLFRLNVLQTAEDLWWLEFVECHAIMDGWSHNSLITELLDCYKSIRQDGKLIDKEPPGIRFADFIAAEQEAMNDSKIRDFWASRLKAFQPHRLPESWGDHSGSANYYDIHVPLDDIEQALRNTASLVGVPFKSVILAAHLTVLAIISGSSRFYTGLVCNGRLEALGGDEVRGMFLNTVPFAIDFNAETDTWPALLKAVFEEEIEIWPNRRYPMPAMAASWGNGARLIDVIFNYLDFHVLDRDAVDLNESVDMSPTEFALHVTTEAGGLLLTADSARIARPYGELLGDLYRGVLESISNNAITRNSIRALPPLLYEKFARLGHGQYHSISLRLPLMAVKEIAAQYPNKIAIMQGDRNISYRELNQRSDQLASFLLKQGVLRGQIVGIYLGRSPDMIVTLLAVQRIGAAYLPIDPDLPEERIKYILADSGATALICDDPLIQKYSLAGVTQIFLSHHTYDERAEVTNLPRSWQPAGNEIAYVIYTSGSTGRPKGVMVTYAALGNILEHMVSVIGLKSDDIFLAVTTISFDIAVVELFAPLLAGGTVTIATRDEARDPERLANLIDEADATALQATPSTWRMLLETGWRPSRGFSVLCGGERFPPDIAACLSETDALVWDLYGPTETTVWSSISPVQAGSRGEWRPVWNTSIHILSDELSPTPPGVIGEIYIGGLGLARGYLGKPGLTAERFLPDPFSAAAGARLYKTGDLARRHLDGTIDIIGRVDNQIKIRGHRVELEEIEAAILKRPDVKAAIVRPIFENGAATNLAAYIVAHDRAEFEINGIQATLRDSLPYYMIPAQFILVDSIPLTANGKVDRNALPDLNPDSRDSHPPLISARTPIEFRLCEIWSGLLGREMIGISDDVFDLGCHSLMVVAAVKRIRDEIGVRVTFQDVFENRSVAALAACLGRRRQDVNEPEKPPSLVWFRRTGTRQPLLCVHPGGGSSHWFSELSRVVDNTRAVGAFEWPGLNCDVSAPSTISEIADRYLEDLLNTSSNEKYNLVGWCGGSSIAWEIAQRLDAEDKLGSFFLLDPVVDVFLRENYISQLDDLRKCQELLESNLAGTSSSDAIHTRVEIVTLLNSIVDDQDGPIVVDGFEDVWLRLVVAWRGLLEARIKYEFRPLARPMHLILSRELRDGRHEVIIGHRPEEYIDRWSKLTNGELKVKPVDGTHFSVLKPPHVHQIAEFLETWME